MVHKAIYIWFVISRHHCWLLNFTLWHLHIFIKVSFRLLLSSVLSCLRRNNIRLLLNRTVECCKSLHRSGRLLLICFLIFIYFWFVFILRKINWLFRLFLHLPTLTNYTHRFDVVLRLLHSLLNLLLSCYKRFNYFLQTKIWVFIQSLLV